MDVDHRGECPNAVIQSFQADHSSVFLSPCPPDLHLSAELLVRTARTGAKLKGWVRFPWLKCEG